MGQRARTPDHHWTELRLPLAVFGADTWIVKKMPSSSSQVTPSTTPRSASWSAQSPDPVVAAGERTTLVVALTNTGSRGWYRGVADQQANLGTSEPQDAERPDLAADWLSANRLTSTTTDYVGPGEVGWFEFTLRAPTTAGEYRLSLRGVVDGAAWLEDDGIFFVIHVLPSVAASGSLSFVR